MKKYSLYASVEEMLSPDALSGLLHQKISSVQCQPYEAPDGYSGNPKFKIQAGDQKLVMKRLRPTEDWLSIVSNDHRCRSVRVWQYGLLDRIRPYLEHAILAGCEDGAGYALLMQDVSAGLFTGKEVSKSMIFTMLDALAAMHAAFWEDERLKDPELGLSNAETLISSGWPQNCHRYSHDAKTVALVTRGWDSLFALLEPDVGDTLQFLMRQPHLLVNKVAEFPSTFIHSDYRTGNMAWLPETRQLVALDWQNASYAPAVICLCWFIMSGEVFEIQNAAAEYYHRQLMNRVGDRLNPGLWQPMLEVGCLVEVLRKGSWHAMFATSHPDEDIRTLMQRSVQTYNDIVRKGIKWL